MDATATFGTANATCKTAGSIPRSLGVAAELRDLARRPGRLLLQRKQYQVLLHRGFELPGTLLAIGAGAPTRSRRSGRGRTTLPRSRRARRPLLAPGRLERRGGGDRRRLPARRGGRPRSHGRRGKALHGRAVRSTTRRSSPRWRRPWSSGGPSSAALPALAGAALPALAGDRALPALNPGIRHLFGAVSISKLYSGARSK